MRTAFTAFPAFSGAAGRLRLVQASNHWSILPFGKSYAIP